MVVAHNLGYDLRVSRAFDVLPAMGWTVGRPVLAGDHVSLDATYEGKTLCLVDSRTVLPTSLGELATKMGKAKLRLPDDDEGPDAWFDRCETDVRLLAEAYMDIVTWLTDDDLGNWARTGPSTGWNVMLRRHLTEKVLVHANPVVRELEAKAMYAGRAETWKWGKLKGGPGMCGTTGTPTPKSAGPWRYHPSLEAKLEAWACPSCGDMTLVPDSWWKPKYQPGCPSCPSPMTTVSFGQLETFLAGGGTPSYWGLRMLAPE